jgi:hypothetical protein
LAQVPYGNITAVLPEADTSRPANSPRVAAGIEEEPSEEAPPPSAAPSRIAQDIDPADGTEELNSMKPPPTEDAANKTVQSPTFEGGTSAGTNPSARDLNTDLAEENPNKVSGTQKHVEFDGFELEDPASLLRTKRPYTYEDTVDIRRHTDDEPESKRLRRDKILKRPLPNADTVQVRAQAEKELELKRRKREDRCGEGAKKNAEDCRGADGESCKATPQAGGDSGEVETAKGNPINIRGA